MNLNMPELPEVEAVRRLISRTLVGQPLSEVFVAEDSLVFPRQSPAELAGVLRGATLNSVGRKGKYFWLDFGSVSLLGHLGMSGWVRALGVGEKRLISHGKAPMEDESGEPKFLKMSLIGGGGRVVFTDGRRLARYWLTPDGATDPSVAKLGPDMLDSPYSAASLGSVLGSRSAPIKSLLLDQALFAGVGNWVADEVLYHAEIAPIRPAKELSAREVAALADALVEVLRVAVEAEADDSKYPTDWLFHVRWGGRHGSETLGGQVIERTTIGGRTAAWVPARQS